MHEGLLFFFSSRRRHTRLQGDWSSDVCSSDLYTGSLSDPLRFDHTSSHRRSSLTRCRSFSRTVRMPAIGSKGARPGSQHFSTTSMVEVQPRKSLRNSGSPVRRGFAMDDSHTTFCGGHALSMTLPPSGLTSQ